MMLFCNLFIERLS